MEFTVFTKPWKLEIPALAKHVAGLGFDGIELPVRPGFPVNPANQAKALPAAARVLADHGLKIRSVAGSIDEASVAACAESGVPLVRVCASLEPGEHYDAGVTRLRRWLEDAVPHLERFGVAVGVQNHCGRDVCHATGIRDLVAPFDPSHVGLVWDAAHNALQGEEPELALDIVWDRLRLVNLKNAYWERINGPEAECALWRPYWTGGRYGLASWPRVMASLQARGYEGPVCLTAEYSDESGVDRLIAEDLAFAKGLLA